jgi:hypothetical protein
MSLRYLDFRRNDASITGDAPFSCRYSVFIPVSYIRHCEFGFQGRTQMLSPNGANSLMKITYEVHILIGRFLSDVCTAMPVGLNRILVGHRVGWTESPVELPAMWPY